MLCIIDTVTAEINMLWVNMKGKTSLPNLRPQTSEIFRKFA
jgi:hypothetical protein